MSKNFQGMNPDKLQNFVSLIYDNELENHVYDNAKEQIMNHITSELNLKGQRKDSDLD